MGTLATADGVEIFYKDWGPTTAQPVVFHHGWPLSSDDWGAKLDRVEGTSGKTVRVHGTRGGSEVVIAGTHLLAAVGRVPNTDGIGLEVAGVEVDSRGHVKVNVRLLTTSAGVWSVGDCAGSPYFTHVAYDDFRVVRDNLAGGNRTTTGRQVAFCLFIDPELARIGLSEREARDRDSLTGW